MNTDTIVGVATGSPDGGVAILRLSGPRAGAIAESLGAALGEPRRLVRRGLQLGTGAGAREDALVVWMPGPRSFTGEDVVELHVHAGALNVREVVEACLGAGARAATAGEFSRRAFANGVLTLDRAEGIAALIGAQTQAGLSQARRLVAGELGDQVRELIEAVHRLRAEIEANLDFPDDVEAPHLARWGEVCGYIGERLETWLSQFEQGRRARELSRVVLVGAPNAGKSSLFNALLGRDRALVATVPGTTRDYVEAGLELGHQGLLLVDTAGLREAGEDAIEAAGIERSREQLAGADLVLHLERAVDVADGLRASEEEEIESACADAGVERWSLWSQGDLLDGEATHRVAARAEACGARLLSSFDVEQIGALRDTLSDWAGGDRPAPWVGLARHRDRVSEARAFVVEARIKLDAGEELELIAFALRAAEQRLGEIDGRSSLGPLGAKLMETIFSSFCIGK